MAVWQYIFIGLSDHIDYDYLHHGIARPPHIGGTNSVPP